MAEEKKLSFRILHSTSNVDKIEKQTQAGVNQAEHHRGGDATDLSADRG